MCIIVLLAAKHLHRGAVVVLTQVEIAEFAHVEGLALVVLERGHVLGVDGGQHTGQSRNQSS